MCYKLFRLRYFVASRNQSDRQFPPDWGLGGGTLLCATKLFPLLYFAANAQRQRISSNRQRLSHKNMRTFGGHEGLSKNIYITSEPALLRVCPRLRGRP